MLRQGTRGPARGMMPGKPSLRQAVMNVRRPREGDQHVHVKQRDAHPSSSPLRTSSSVMGRACGEIEKTGKLFGADPFPTRVVAFRPRRASSDNTFPTGSDRSLANAFAAANRSSSIVNVVLMSLHCNSFGVMSRCGRIMMWYRRQEAGGRRQEAGGRRQEAGGSRRSEGGDYGTMGDGQWTMGRQEGGGRRPES